MSHHNRQNMYAALGVAAGVVSVFYSLTSWTAARAKGRAEGRCDVLGQLARFGSNRVRWMCLNIGIRFTNPENSDGDEEWDLFEGLTTEIRAVLEAELRAEMRGQVERELRTVLKGEVQADARLMGTLRIEAKESVTKDLKESSAVKGEVRMEIKREIRAELTRSGRDVTLIAEAMKDLRAETRDQLRNKMRSEVRNQLRIELNSEVKESLKNEVRKEIMGGKVEGDSDDSGSCWTSYTEQTVTSSIRGR